MTRAAALSLALFFAARAAAADCTPKPANEQVTVSLAKGSRLKDLAEWYRSVTCTELHAPLSASDAPLGLALEGKIAAGRALEVAKAAAASAGYELNATSLSRWIEPCEAAKARALLDKAAAAKVCALDLEAFGRVRYGSLCVDTRVTLEPLTDGKARFKVSQVPPGSLLHVLGLREGDLLDETAESLRDRTGKTPFVLEVTRGKEKKKLECQISGGPEFANLHPAAILAAQLAPQFLPAPAGSRSDCGLEEGAITRNGDTVEVTSKRTLELECLSTAARIVPSFKDGKAQGFKVFSMRPNSLLAQIGLQNGDVVKTINGRELSSPDQALETYAALRSAKKFELAVERRGAPLTLTVILK